MGGCGSSDCALHQAATATLTSLSGNLPASPRPAEAGRPTFRLILYYNNTSPFSSGSAIVGRPRTSGYAIGHSGETVNIFTGLNEQRRCMLYHSSGHGLYPAPHWRANTVQGHHPGGPWTETQPDGVAFNYNTSGLLSSIQSKVGSRWTLSYNANGSPTIMTDPFARRTSFSYDGSNNIRHIQDSGGRITSFTVNGNGDLVQIVSPELCVTNLTYCSRAPLAPPAPSVDRSGRQQNYIYVYHILRTRYLKFSIQSSSRWGRSPRLLTSPEVRAPSSQSGDEPTGW